jgi:transcriptional regulator GlxA family with amidase domain
MPPHGSGSLEGNTQATPRRRHQVRLICRAFQREPFIQPAGDASGHDLHRPSKCGQAQFIPAAVPTEREARRFSHLLEWIRTQLDQHHTIEGLAARAGMSARTFQRRFVEATGMPVMEWLAAERLARARELLEEGGASLDDIAVSAGFGSLAAMRHHFRRRLGTSPTAYRAHCIRQGP